MKPTKERRDAMRRHERTSDAIDKLMRKWKSRLWLNGWHIDTVIEWNGIDAKGDGTVAANCTADWRYLHATVRFNIPAMSVMSADEIERTVVHELLHIHVNEMRETGLPHEERVVSQLTCAIMAMERE